MMKRSSVELSSFRGMVSQSACAHSSERRARALSRRTVSSYTQPVCRPHGMSTSSERTMYP